MNRPVCSGAALLAAVCIVSAVHVRNAAQTIVPATAWLDVQIFEPPTPVRIAGRPHLAYELHITNFRTAEITLERIAIADGEQARSTLGTFEDADLRNGLARVGQRPDSSDNRTIPPGGRVIFFVWLSLDGSARLPVSLTHRIAYAISAPDGREIGTVAGSTVVRRGPPVALGPPLRGGPWAAVYDPSLAAGHRRAVFAIDGRARIPARFAIDWVKIDAESRAAVRPGGPVTTMPGYGEDVLAVADATVSAAVDRFPEPTVPISLATAAGNYVALALRGGRFAFYEHLRPGSVRVRVGDRVSTGQVIASLGASGSVSSGPHLHFHVADTNSSLGAEGIPFVLRRFETLGAFESLAGLGRGEPWIAAPVETRQMEMPRQQTVIRF